MAFVDLAKSRIREIDGQIAALTRERTALVSAYGPNGRTATGIGPRRGGRPKGFKMSDEAKAKIAAAARERWAKRKVAASK